MVVGGGRVRGEVVLMLKVMPCTPVEATAHRHGRPELQLGKCVTNFNAPIQISTH